MAKGPRREGGPCRHLEGLRGWREARGKREATLEEVGLRVLREANAIKERGASSFWYSIMLHLS